MLAKYSMCRLMRLAQQRLRQRGQHRVAGKVVEEIALFVETIHDGDVALGSVHDAVG